MSTKKPTPPVKKPDGKKLINEHDQKKITEALAKKPILDLGRAPMSVRLSVAEAIYNCVSSSIREHAGMMMKISNIDNSYDADAYNTLKEVIETKTRELATAALNDIVLPVILPTHTAVAVERVTRTTTCGMPLDLQLDTEKRQDVTIISKAQLANLRRAKEAAMDKGHSKMTKK